MLYCARCAPTRSARFDQPETASSFDFDYSLTISLARLRVCASHSFLEVRVFTRMNHYAAAPCPEFHGETSSKKIADRRPLMLPTVGRPMFLAWFLSIAPSWLISQMTENANGRITAVNVKAKTPRVEEQAIVGGRS
jgi:hypothetical protein